MKRFRNDENIKSIGSVMVRKVIAVSSDSTAQHCAKKLALHKIGCVAVLEGKELVGIVSERDIAVQIGAKGKNPVTTKVSEIMTARVVTARFDDSLAKVAGMMHKSHIRHIPVVDGESHLIGILSMRDLLTRIESNLKSLVREKTKDLNSDPLTGLYNYRFFNNYMDAEIARSSRHSHQLSLLYIDIDHFKMFNDSHGHAKGNVLLKAVSNLLKPKDMQHLEGNPAFSTRKSDIGVRIGGDEFVLILPETSKESSLFCAERLRQAVEQTIFLRKKNQEQHVTVSIGIASFPADATGKKDLLEKADKALYQAKKLGRNRVYVYA
ncbi:MAG: GGDEF domain-containing protein [Candidatus Omnitrophica bacterium]|nr:GGDEF domain-containing protein [Candidatus Omnitrophota bacterium]